MSIVDENTKVIVQGLTGGRGRFLTASATGTTARRSWRVTPGKGGQEVEGILTLDMVAEGSRGHGRDGLVRVRAANAAAPRIPRGAAAGVPLRVHHRGHPRRGRGTRVQHAAPRHPAPVCSANRPGIISPGEVQHRHHRRRDRPATNRRQAVGGDRQPHPRRTRRSIQPSSTASACRPVSASATTRFLIVHRCAVRPSRPMPTPSRCFMIGEIGGSAEEEAAAFIEASMTKAVVAYIGGGYRSRRQEDGHAGAIGAAVAGHCAGEDWTCLWGRRSPGRLEPDRSRRADGRDRCPGRLLGTGGGRSPP